MHRISNPLYRILDYFLVCFNFLHHRAIDLEYLRLILNGVRPKLTYFSGCFTKKYYFKWNKFENLLFYKTPIELSLRTSATKQQTNLRKWFCNLHIQSDDWAHVLILRSKHVLNRHFECRLQNHLRNFVCLAHE